MRICSRHFEIEINFGLAYIRLGRHDACWVRGDGLIVGDRRIA
jgi:hypothetical protein